MTEENTPQEETHLTTTPRETMKETSRLRITKSTLGFLLFLWSVALILLALVTALFLRPKWEEHQAHKELSQAIAQSGSLTSPLTSSRTAFTGPLLKEGLTGQKAPSEDGHTSSTSIIYGSKQAPSRLDIYMDFTTARSRDFLLLNQEVLQGAIISGRTQVAFHLMPHALAYNSYSEEAFLEAATTPGNTTSWNLLYSLLTHEAVLNGKETQEEALHAVTSVTENYPTSSITSQSIQGGMFASWLAQEGSDKRAQVGYSLPIVYLKGSLLDARHMNLNNPTVLKGQIEEASHG